MKAGEALREVVAKRGYSIRSFAEQIGVSNTSLGRSMGRDNVPASTIVKYLDELGYDLAYVPKGSKLPDGSYLIDNGGE